MRIFSTFSLLALFIAAVYADEEEIDGDMKRKKPCPQPPLPANDCPVCGSCSKNYLVKMDFYHVKPVLEEPGQNWVLFTDPLNGYVANDGVFSTSCHGGFVDSTVFHNALVSFNRFDDNIKFFMYGNNTVAIPNNGDLVIEFYGSAQTYNIDLNPYPKEITQVNDFRFANGVFAAFDFVTGLVFEWILTNDRVYIAYSRIVTADLTQGRFQFVVPVKVRKPCDFHDMKIVFHGSSKSVSWRLEGKPVFRINRVGYYIDRMYMTIDAGGIETSVYPLSVHYGFGTGSTVNAYPACKRSDDCCDCKFPSVRMGLANTCDEIANALLPPYNPLLGPPNLANFWFQPNYTAGEPTQMQLDTYYVWGQGATLNINKLIVYQDFCAGRKC